MYDMHCHILPGLDDGSRSIDESLLMIKQYIQSGYKGLICSSHYDKNKYLVSKDMVMRGIEELKKAIKDAGIEFEIYPGNEIQIDENTLQDIIDGNVLRLNDSRYVLCELPFFNKPIYAELIFDQILEKGWVPIIAHAERYRYVANDIDWLIQFIEKGCLIQANVSSINNDSYKDTLIQMLNRNMVHILGTDSHQADWRSPLVSDDLAAIKDLVGPEKFKLMTNDRIISIIKDKEIDSRPQDILYLDNYNKKKTNKWYKFWKK